MYDLLATLVVATHVGFAVFVLAGGLGLSRAPRLAWLHIPSVVWAIAISVVGWPCPLTDLEKWLRELAGQVPYSGEFLPYYLWAPLGMSGSEPVIVAGLIAVILVVNTRPYIAWARA